MRALLMGLRNLVARPTRTLLTLFGIVLGVSVIIAVSITNDSTLSSLTSVFGEVSGSTDLIVISSTDEEGGFPQDARRWVAGVPGVEAAAPSVHALAVLASDSAPTDMSAGLLGAIESRLTIYGVDPRTDRDVRQYKIVDGAWLVEDLDVYEVVLVKDFADDNDLEVGDDVPILTQSGIERVRVVGLISKEGAGQLNNGMFGAMPLGAAQELFSRAGDLDQIDIVATEQYGSSDGLERLREAVQEKLGTRYSVTYPATQGERVSQMLTVYTMGLSMFSVIAVFVGAFLIYNAFSMTIVERTREIGMMRTIGMTREQVMSQILAEAVILGIVGSGLGIAGGVLLAGGLIGAMELVIAQEVAKVTVPVNGVVSGVIVGLITTLLAALLPAWQAGRVSPLEALRVRGRQEENWLVRYGWVAGAILFVVSLMVFLLIRLPAELQMPVMSVGLFMMFGGATLLTPLTIGPWERIARPFTRLIFGGEGRLGGSNIQRSKMRTTLTVTALMVGIAMLLAVQAMTEAFQKDLGEWIDGYMGGDLYVYSAMPMRPEFAGRLEALEGIESVAGTRYLYVTVKRPNGTNETVALHVVEPLKYERVGSFTFASSTEDAHAAMQRLAEGDAVFLSTLIADRYGLGLGDSLQIQTRRGLRDFEVAGIVIDFYDQGMVIEGSWRDMRQYFRVNDVAAFQVKVEEGYSSDTVRDTIDEIYGTRRNLASFSNEALKSVALGISTQAFALFDVLSWIAVVVASLGVVNTLMMNVLERTREIGMLRGVGMTRWQVVKMILAEAGVMGVIGGVLGIVVGLFLARVLIVSTNAMQGYNLEYVIPTQGLGVAFVIALAISQLAALWPSARAARLEIIEAIQFE